MNLIQIIKKFPTQDDCVKHIEEKRWRGVVTCPYCGTKHISKHTELLTRQSRWQCLDCKKSFSVTVGTIFHHTHIPLQKWFLAVLLMLNAKKGLSSRQLARDLELPVKTAYSLSMRIRQAMTQDEAALLRGIVEMDETYIGGKPRKSGNGDDGDTPKNKRGRGTKKQAVVGMIERNGDVKATVAKGNKLTFRVLSDLVRKSIDIKNTTLYTDDYRGYCGMNKILEHGQVDHSSGIFTLGNISTNCIESFWAIVKRGIIGQYHKVSKEYLHKYMDEFCYRFNGRHTDPQVMYNTTIDRLLFV